MSKATLKMREAGEEFSLDSLGDLISSDDCFSSDGSSVSWEKTKTFFITVFVSCSLFLGYVIVDPQTPIETWDETASNNDIQNDGRT